MNRNPLNRWAFSPRWWAAVGIVVAIFLAPSVVKAADPIKALKNSLKIDPNKLVEPAVQREHIAKILPELKSISQLRRAYFLEEWPQAGKVAEVDAKIVEFRNTIGERLKKAVFDAVKEPNTDKKIAVAMMIAEMGERDQREERGPTGKFASAFVEILIKGKKGVSLAENADLRVKQVALHALGKITPKPADATPALRAALTSAELGPRRIAAYALTDLIKNANYLERDDELETVASAVNAAVLGLREFKKEEAVKLGLPGRIEDEPIRAYCLQAIFQAARIFTDYGKATDTAIVFDMLSDKDKTEVLHPKVAKILGAFDAANPRIAAALKADGNINSTSIRLTALEALTQIVSARARVMEKLTEKEDAVPADKRLYRGDLFKKFHSADPIGYFLEFDADSQKQLLTKADAAALRWNWETIPSLLHPENDARLRRGAMALLEAVAEDIEAAQAEKKLAKNITPELRRRLVRVITPGLFDNDRFVRWSSARTLRHVALEHIDAEIIRGLGLMLIDPIDRDPDLSLNAITTLEAIAAAQAAPLAVNYLKSAIIDREKDVELRESAIRTLVQIGNEAERQKLAWKTLANEAANSAFPELTSVLTDPDVRIRRAAAEALGLLGHPKTPGIYDQAIAALKLAMRDEDSQVRQNASEAILSIELPAR